MTTFEEILLSEEEGPYGFLGIITLNRPAAYNALSHDMIRCIYTQLQQWSQNKRLLAVAIRSTFDKAFCAGGDIRTLYDCGQKGDFDALRAFFFDEYHLNYRIHTFPKPWISFINGITMGGGVGISIHARHRVATETLRFAMPECAIGFFPDVGGSYFLSRCPGELGTYLGLSGETIHAADALYCQLIDHCIPTTHHPDVMAQLLQTDLRDENTANSKITAILKQYEIALESPPLANKREGIDRYFKHATVEDIITHLKGDPNPWCQDLAAMLQQKSPLSLKVTRQQLQRGKTLNLASCLQMEYRLAQHFIADKDFYEGVRAQIIVKDKSPRWQPATLEAVDDKMVNDYFSMTGKELGLDER